MLALIAGGVPSARAVDLLEGRVQVHGYFEEQVRGISRNWNEQLDLTQWANILRIDTDASILQDPIGPLDSLRSYIRLEARYDCVYTRACGLFPSVDVYGDRAAKLPDRLANGQLGTFAGVNEIIPPSPALIGNRPGGLNEVYGFNVLFGFQNPDGVPAHAPALYTFKDYLDYRFAQREMPGGRNGTAADPLGPWLPENNIFPVGALNHIANPFSSQDFNPIIPNLNAAGQVVFVGGFGSGALPFRPAPTVQNVSLTGNYLNAQGVYYPSQGLVNYLDNSRNGTTMANFSQSQLAWNHTFSNSETYEFKEGYLHAEFLDGRAWLRVGKQLIVWGKTELFAVTDQFNPRNQALSSLPSLEESRIPVWAARAVYNFYNVGPFEDVRLEGALNLDRFTPDDIGVCGMPYAVNAVCEKAFGLFAHGLTGVGLAGQTSPPEWWQSTQGLQGGARLEFRWDRYSFALVDLYNYVRVPFVNQIYTYSRNVDPITGMPRASQSTGSCQLGGLVADPTLNGAPSAIAVGKNCLTPQTALKLQSANQTLFAMICSTTVGFSKLDSSACSLNVLGSSKIVAGFPLSLVLSGLLAGNPIFNNAAAPLLGAPQLLPLVNLGGGLGATLSASLTPQQQALLGCGPFYHTFCDGSFGGKVVPGGIDLLNMEASVVTQSMVGFEGTSVGWTTDNRAVAQPGTVGFVGGPVATRLVGNTIVILPGARGPGDPGYNPAVDGNPAGLGFNPTLGNPGYCLTGHPFTCQPWKNVMAAFSWNLEMILVTQSTTAPNVFQTWDHQPFATASVTQCSYRRPDLCIGVSQFLAVTGVQRNNVQAAGNGVFGRRDFVWDSGGEANLQYQKRNVLGFSMDFAEDVTKSNWGIEFGWEQHLPFLDNNQFNNLSKSDELELSVSVDRPTFINFLNQNRTFFFNSQFFFSYLTNYSSGFQVPGPFGVLGTFTISTGYFQDRLLPSVTFVYDVFSTSGAALPELTYRFTENFSFALGIEQFLGKWRGQAMPLNPIATVDQQTGRDAYRTFSEPGLSLIRDRDEVYFRLRYTF